MKDLEKLIDGKRKEAFRKELGARVRLFRKRLGLKQDELAAHLDFGRSNLARIEKGAVFPSMFALNVFKNDFNLSLDWLLYNEGVMFTGEENENERTIPDTCKEELQELRFYMRKISMLRHAVLGFFLRYKAENNQLIQQLLEEVEKMEAQSEEAESPETPETAIVDA